MVHAPAEQSAELAQALKKMLGGFSKQKKGLFCRAKGGGAGTSSAGDALDGGDGDESAGGGNAAAVRLRCADRSDRLALLTPKPHGGPLRARVRRVPVGLCRLASSSQIGADVSSAGADGPGPPATARNS